MNIKLHIPPFIYTIAKFLFLTWGILLFARIIMVILLWSDLSNLPYSQILYAFYLGSKFDMRIAIIISIPLCLFLTIPPLEKRLKKLTPWVLSLYTLIITLVLLLYITDIGYFFYLRQRLDATLFDFLINPAISLHMVWESYPIFWITITFCLSLCLWLYPIYLILTNSNVTILSPLSRTCWTLVGFVILFLLSYGQVNLTFFPLRWSNAYFSVNKDLVILGLNPIQNLYDTYRITSMIPPDITTTQKSYPRIAQWLNVTELNKKNLNFNRIIKSQKPPTPINIVIIVMESLAWPRTSLAPGEENPTPNIKKLAKESLLFPLFFAPARTTARAIFTIMTGIPDVNRSGGTSSRNQKLINQHLIMDEFKGYEKYYMLGGSASWANIRGLLDHNIEELKIFEEGKWHSPSIDVWGISDLDLFRESIEIFNNSSLPFIAVIQTSSFHKPYSIPKDNAGFISKKPTPEILANYGYGSVAEYNSMCFADHALGEFFALASNQPWFQNTIFAIFGDHGLNDPSLNMTPGYLACRLQSNHIPLLLYAPGKIQPGEYPYPCGHPDVFPTLASLAGLTYHNQTMGRNLLDPATHCNAKQFIAGETEAFFRLVQDGYCYLKEETEGLYCLTDTELHNLIEQDPERAQSMRQAATDFFAIAKYMLYNNKHPKRE